MSYTKLADSILTSTIWMEDDPTRIVWLTMLAMSDKNGEVHASIPGLANIARVSIESCRTAISKFLSPDPDSRTKDDEGRRLEEIDGGWFLINHEKYRKLASDDDRKQKAAERQKRWRQRNARNGQVTPPERQNTHTDTDTDTDTDTENTKPPLPPKGKRERKAKKFVKPTLSEIAAYFDERNIELDPDEFWNFYESKGWMVGKNKMVSWRSCVVTWLKARKNRPMNGKEPITFAQQRETNMARAIERVKQAENSQVESMKKIGILPGTE